MREIKEIRRENLRVLVEQHGGVASLNSELGRKRTDSTLSQILNQAPDTKTQRPKGMGDRIARDIEEKLSLGYGWMDTEHDIEPADQNLIYIERFNVSASCGHGYKNYDDECYVEKMAVSRSWFENNVSAIRDRGYQIITLQGDSMEPTFKNGDLAIVDTLDKNISRDGIFCCVIDGDLYVKRVQHVPGSLLFRSDNAFYEPFSIPNNEVESRVIVCGRVIKSLNLKQYD